MYNRTCVRIENYTEEGKHTLDHKKLLKLTRQRVPRVNPGPKLTRLQAKFGSQVRKHVVRLLQISFDYFIFDFVWWSLTLSTKWIHFLLTMIILQLLNTVALICYTDVTNLIFELCFWTCELMQYFKRHALTNLPAINQFVHGQHYNVQIIHQHFFLNAFSQNLTHSVIKCIQDAD